MAALAHSQAGCAPMLATIIAHHLHAARAHVLPPEESKTLVAQSAAVSHLLSVGFELLESGD